MIVCIIVKPLDSTSKKQNFTQIFDQSVDSSQLIEWKKGQESGMFHIIYYLFLKEFALYLMKQCDKQGKCHKVNKYLIESLPVKCKMYLNLLISLKEDTYNEIPKIIRKNYQNFSSVFQKLDDSQRVYFINKNIEFVQKKLNTSGSFVITPPNICEIETTCEVKATFMKMTFWEKRTIKYEYNHQRVKFCTSKKQEIIDLKYYLVRKSHSQKNGLVLESFDPSISQKLQRISFKFSSASICQEIFNRIRESIVQLSFKRTECLLYDDLKDEKDLKMAQEKQAIDFAILTSKNISQFFQEKEVLIGKLRRARRDVFEIYSKSNLVIMNSTANSKLYYLQYAFPQSWNSLNKIKENIKILNSTITSNDCNCEVLERFNATVSANYYKIRSQTHQFELIMIVDQNQKGGEIQQIMKSTNNIFFGVNVHFMEIIIKKAKDKQQFMIMVNAIIKNNNQKKTVDNQQIIIKFLSSLVKSSSEHTQVRMKTVAASNDFSPVKKLFQAHSGNSSPVRIKSMKRQFRTEIYDCKRQSPEGQIRLEVPFQQKSSQQDEERDEVFYSIEDIEQLQDNQKIQDIYHTISSKLIEINEEVAFDPTDSVFKPQTNYLKAKCIDIPQQKTQIKLIAEHNLTIDWKKSSKGGVICINREAIEQQKKVIKLIFNQLGSKIFQMKGMMNFSLPIQICRPQSVLVSLGRNISYAPLLLQNISTLTAVQRMKKMIMLHISWCSLALSTQKPFNPILGETYQGFINGCPLFMEQVCHHPAISYLYFVGRGYKIYGSVCPVPQIRLNYVNAPSEQLLTIQFQNGNKCQFSVPMIVINGLLIGQRTIYYDGMGHVIDAKNQLIAEVRYNAKNNSLFKAKQNPDFFMGEIYQVSEAFIAKFLSGNRKTSLKKDDKNRVIETISGQWNGAVMFNGQKVFDFQQQLPVMLENSECPLASDGIFREDIRCKKIGDLVKGQQEKERLQEIQRRDKRLRNEWKQNNK